MSDIFREVDEIMHAERMQKYWDDYGNYLIGGIIAIILLTAGVSGYGAWSHVQKTEQTDLMFALTEDADYPAVVTEMDLQMAAGAEALTKLNAALALIEEGKDEQAAALYDRLADNKSAPADLRDLGALMSVRLGLIQNEEPPVDDYLAKLNRIWGNTSSPWQAHAYIEAASLQAHIKGNYETALGYLNAVEAMDEQPAALYEQAAALKHIYMLKMAESQKAATDTEGDT
jgi:hypothetical protein